jgi:hypothetical protein
MLYIMKKHKKLFTIATTALVIVLGLGFALVRNSEFWPQEEITVALPFDKVDDPPYGIEPMGETEVHNPPVGHPGIDFQWTYPARLLSSIDGKVKAIYEDEEKGIKQWNVEIANGKYITRYNELGDYNRDLKVGNQVNVGDFIGTPHETSHRNPNVETGEIQGHYQVHWEFGYTKIIFAGKGGRLCPTPFLNQHDSEYIEELWLEVGNTYDGKFPYLCSGVYEIEQAGKQ